MTLLQEHMIIGDEAVLPPQLIGEVIHDINVKEQKAIFI